MKNLFKKILAIGLAASMTLGMAVTSFADGTAEETPETPIVTETPEDPEEPTIEPTTPAVEYDAEVWVNGKDIKANAKKGTKEDLNKTALVPLADLLVKDTTEDEKPAETTAATEAPASSDSESESEDDVIVDPADNEVAQSSSTAENEETPTTTPSTGSTTTPPEEEVEVQIGLSETLPDKTKYLISVLDAAEGNTVATAFPSNKAVKSKKATAKFDKKTKSFKVTAGKETGAVEVWIAEYNSKSKTITAYTSFDVIVKMAPKKFTVQIPAVEAKEIKDEEGNVIKTVEAQDAVEKKVTLPVGEDFGLKVVLPEGVTADESTTYTWSVKTPKTEKAYVRNNHIEYTDAEEEALGALEETAGIRVEGDGTVASVYIANSTEPKKALNYTITCTNDQSGKKASFKLTVVNDITDISFENDVIEVPDAAAAKTSATVNLAADGGYFVNTSIGDATSAEIKSLDSTSKVKAYISSKAVLSDMEDGVYNGFTYTKGEKKDTFKLTDKSKEVSVKLAKTGEIVVTAKKGTAAGTEAKLILVVTHKDKTIDIYENLIMVGKKAEEEKKCTCTEAPAEGEAHETTCPLYVAPTEPVEECTCTEAPAEGEAHEETCPLYVAPTEPVEECTCTEAPAEGGAHEETCPLYVAPTE